MSNIENIPSQNLSLEAYKNSRGRVAAALSETTIGQNEFAVISEELYSRRTEDLRPLSAEAQAKKIADSAGEILPYENFVGRLSDAKATGKPLRVKYGIDPTGADVHLGHAVPMLILDRMQRMGHRVMFIVGDFTAKIGDPTGRVSSRPLLTDEVIEQNMATYADQVRPLFDMDKVELAKNSEWLDDYPLSDLIAITLKIPVSSLLQRRDFQQRIESGSGITQGELLYPVVMALDSVQLNSDVEIGGRDQFLNLQMCRKVMEVCGKEPEVIITTDILEGTDGSGNKMSKSQGNYVGLVQEPGEMFGRIMSIPDKLLGQYYKMLTEIEKQEWEQLEGLMQSGKVNPMEIKKLLAMDIVAALHDPETAKESRIRFEQQFSTRNYDAVADGMPVIDSGSDILTQLSEARQESRSAIRRLLQQGGVQFIDESGESIKPKSFEELETSMAPTTKFIKIGKTVMRISGEIPRG